MKTKKFKVDRKNIEDIHSNLFSMMQRSKSMMAYIVDNDIEENYLFHLASKYYQTSSSYFNDLTSLLGNSSSVLDFLIVSKEMLSKFSEYKKELDSIEELFAKDAKYSIREH